MEHNVYEATNKTRRRLYTVNWKG